MTAAAILVLTTVGSRDQAAAIAGALVAERLAACVQIAPIESWYRWQGAVEQAAEYRLHIKTTADVAPAAEARIRALHPYELPEIVTIPVGGSPDYVAWVEAEVSSPVRDEGQRR